MDAAPPGSFVLIPGGVTHDFENRGEVRAGVLNFYAPGTFEEHMPEIARWWRENPPRKHGLKWCQAPFLARCLTSPEVPRLRHERPEHARSIEQLLRHHVRDQPLFLQHAGHFEQP